MNLQAGGVAGLAEQNNRISVLLLLQSVAVSGSSRFSNCFSFALQRNLLYKGICSTKEGARDEKLLSDFDRG